MWQPVTAADKITNWSQVRIAYAAVVSEDGKKTKLLWPPHTTLDAAQAATEKAYRDAGITK